MYKELSALALSDRVRMACPDSISFFCSRVKHNSESERRSPSSEDDRDEKESKAEIQNPEDYKEIFQPRNAICQYQGLLCFSVVFGIELWVLNWFSRSELWLTITEASPVTGRV